MKKIIYMWLVSFFSLINKVKNPQNITYLMSFNGNHDFIVQLAKFAQQNHHKLVILYTPNCRDCISRLRDLNVETFRFKDSFSFLFHHLSKVMNSKLLFCDNYFAFLGGCHFDHSKTHIVQLWHADGAIKTFGWEEPKTQKRSQADKRRFQKVYDQFDEYPVGSEKMGKVFVQSYHVPFTKMSLRGYPRSDQLFDKQNQLKIQKEILMTYPILKGKEILLYAPTYRENNNGNVALQFPNDFEKVIMNLQNNQRLIIKLHPHLKSLEVKLKEKFKNKKIVWVDSFTMNDLLLITDRLITDYSSVIFDYSLLPTAKEIIFYCYDWDQYSKEIGIQADFKEWAPGPILNTTVDLVNELAMPLLKTDFSEFNNLWNTFNDGKATQRILNKEKQYLK